MPQEDPFAPIETPNVYQQALDSLNAPPKWTPDVPSMLLGALVGSVVLLGVLGCLVVIKRRRAHRRQIEHAKRGGLV